MIAKNISQTQLEDAATKLGFSIQSEDKGNNVRFTIRKGTNDKYRHISRTWSGDRRTGSVCLHGHYHFFKECFALAATAQFESQWYGKIVHTADTLDENYDNMRKINVGAPIMGYVPLDSCCDCGEAIYS